MRSFFARLAAAAAIAGLAAPVSASAHFPFFMPGPAPSIDSAVALPSARAAWRIFGVLRSPGQIDFIRLDDLDPGQASSIEVDVFNKPAYLSFAPSIAIIGQGLPAPAAPLPFSPPDGYGVCVCSGDFSGDPTQRKLFTEGANTWLLGTSLYLPPILDSPAYLAIWNPTGQTGEYTVTLNVDPNLPDPSLEGKYTDPVPGDANDNGTVDVGDATTALRIAVGIAVPTPRQLRALDVFPPSQGVRMAGDGKITIPDVIRVLKRAVGIEPDPFP